MLVSFFLAAQCPDEAWTASSQSPVSDVRTRPFIPHRLSVGPVHGSVVRAGTSQLYVLLNASTRDSFRKLQKPVVCMLITTIPTNFQSIRSDLEKNPCGCHK